MSEKESYKILMKANTIEKKIFRSVETSAGLPRCNMNF